MRPFVLAMLIGSVVSVSGCATIALPQGPDIYSFTQQPGAPTILVARPADLRPDKKKIGTISLLSLSMKADPSELVGKEAVAALYERGINGRLEPIPADQPAGFADAIQRSNADGLLALSIQSLSVESFDAIMDPPTCELALQATLYDRQGSLVESSNATGHVQRGVNTFATERSVGELVGETTHDAVRRLVNQPAMAEALRKRRSNE